MPSQLEETIYTYQEINKTGYKTYESLSYLNIGKVITRTLTPMHLMNNGIIRNEVWLDL